LFAGLLDQEGGCWRIQPVEPVSSIRRKYLDRSLVLETVFETPRGELVLRDALAVGEGNRDHQLGQGAPHVLLRQMQCRAGRVDIKVEISPRPEYGLVKPLLHPVPEGLLIRGGAARLLLSSSLEWALKGSTASAVTTLEAGEVSSFALQFSQLGDRIPSGWDQIRIQTRLEDTLHAWQSWSDLHQSYQGPWQEMVHLSGRVLQGLTYQPTGAIVAAPTTSLPEVVGGERNWDYRYTWIRDASLTLDALWVAACPDEAEHFFDFLAGTAMTQLQGSGELQIMFGVDGRHDLSERELAHLSGWRSSAPVRVGNGAWNQRQLDVYGELLAAAGKLREQLSGLDVVSRGFLADAADAAAERWREQDRGIWEIRGEPQDYLYSKLMCWVALDQGIQLADLLDAEDRVGDWQEQRDRIRKAVLQQGWSDRLGAYSQAFGTHALDAANLMLLLMGFLPPDDQRMQDTIDAVEKHLTDESGYVYRYRSDDGLKGEEGAFLLCTFWLSQARARSGEIDRAKEIFQQAADCANDLGLLAEEIDPVSGELLGNFPQAFSHIGLINAAWAIHQAEQTS
jgi:GH15 family glucan-1,4-alpha-glucosidase